MQLYFNKFVQMNKYPGTRSFTAIGMGTPEFKASMVQAVTSVVGEPLQPNQLSERPSSKGQYVSLTIGPVVVTSPEQVSAHGECPAYD